MERLENFFFLFTTNTHLEIFKSTQGEIHKRTQETFLTHTISIKVAISLNVRLRNQKSFFSRVLHDSTPRFVGPSVRPSRFTFFRFLRSLASLLQPK